MVFEKLLEDPAVKQNFIFLVIGIMLGILCSIMKNYLTDAPVKTPKTAGGEGSDGEDWEDEDSEDEDASNANVEQTPQKDKALTDQFPIDDVKMMLAVRTDLGMTKGKIGA